MPFSRTGAVLVDLTGRIAFASTHFCDLVGIEHDKIKGMSYFDFVYPDDTDEARKRFELCKDPDPEPFQCQLRRIDGNSVRVNIQCTALREPNGNVYAITATVVAAA